jgi:predicted ATPase/DNA-binding CsgD family transcriptional regulator
VALTAREREILHLMTGDLTNAEIAEQLVVTPETVKWYTKQIYSKLDAHSRDEAVQIARDRHLLGQAASVTDVDVHPSYIPLPTTPLVGRDAELSDICGYLLRDGIRLITLTGPPGIGKTRLSLHAAAQVKDSFGNGAFFVGLASITNPLHVPGAIAGILNLSAAGTMPLLEMLKNYLRGKHLLLVLDNFEQIMDAASTVAELLVAAPGLKLLVTSREVLRLSSEQQYPIPPLAMPDLRAPLVAGTISQVAAVDLFVQRARAIKHTFTLTNDNAPNVAQLCARLEGLPLAIELAAARIKLFSPAELLNGLSSRLNVLKANLRDLPSRQQTLRGAIDWSYALLSEDEERLFSRMGVFHNGGTLTAASVVCGAGLETDIVDLIESVVDKSLLTVREDGGTEPCFTMLEMMREYALEKLAETEELAAIRQAHTHYFAAMCADAEARWHTPAQTEWLDKLEREIDNIRAALDWSVTHDTETAALMMAQLWLLWSARGYHAEGDRWYEVVLAHSQRLSPLLKARVLACSGLFASYTGNLQRAVARRKEGE